MIFRNFILKNVRKININTINYNVLKWNSKNGFTSKKKIIHNRLWVRHNWLSHKNMFKINFGNVNIGYQNQFKIDSSSVNIDYPLKNNSKLILLAWIIDFWSCLLTGALENASSKIDVRTAYHLRSSLDLLQDPAKKWHGAAAADRTPTLKSVTVSPNTKNWNRANSLSHEQLCHSQA